MRSQVNVTLSLETLAVIPAKTGTSKWRRFLRVWRDNLRRSSPFEPMMRCAHRTYRRSTESAGWGVVIGSA
jgi:hypothetical protein